MTLAVEVINHFLNLVDVEILLVNFPHPLKDHATIREFHYIISEHKIIIMMVDPLIEVIFHVMNDIRVLLLLDHKIQ